MRARGYVLDSVILKRPTANDRKMAGVDATDMKVFIMLHGPLLEYKNARKF